MAILICAEIVTLHCGRALVAGRGRAIRSDKPLGEGSVQFWIVAVLSLYPAQLFVPSLFRVVQPSVGLLRYVGSRDDLPPLGNIGRRSERAVRNLAESLPFFVTAAVLTIALGREGDLGLAGAQIFFWARIAYLGLYLAALPWVRSAMWSVAFAGIVAMAWPLLIV